MAKDGKDNNHTRHIASRMYFVRNGEKCKMYKIDWCERGLQLAYIGAKPIKVGQLTMAHMFQNQLPNPVQKVSTMQNALQEWI